jgi:hypothetical protein
LSAPWGNQSSPPTDEHSFNSRRNHTHSTQKASRVLVSKVAFECRAYGAKRSSWVRTLIRSGHGTYQITLACMPSCRPRLTPKPFWDSSGQGSRKKPSLVKRGVLVPDYFLLLWIGSYAML